MKKQAKAKKLTEVRIGVIGVGNMGTSHISNIERGLIKRARLTAICDIVPSKMDRYGDKYLKFTDSRALIRSGEVDAVMVETPHYDHTTIGIDALTQGIHTLVEKPISVHKADCERLIAAHKDKKVVFSAMFNQRTDPHYIKLREIIKSGQLGEITRVNWIITTWFRPQAYYDGGGWRATWKAVALRHAEEGPRVRRHRQVPRHRGRRHGHGLPRIPERRNRRVRHDDRRGPRHQPPRGLRRPRQDRRRGRQDHLDAQHGRPEGVPADRAVDVRHARDVEDRDPRQRERAPARRLDGTPLIAPAEEGINSVELGTSMLFSSFKDKTVELPLSGKAYEAMLKGLIKNSTFKKTVKEVKMADMSASFTKA